MGFIGRRVEKDKQQRAADFRPRPGGQVVFRLIQRAPEKQGENGVFNDVRAFAEEVMDLLDVRLRHLGKEPVQKRFDKQRGVFVGMRVA